MQQQVITRVRVGPSPQRPAALTDRLVQRRERLPIARAEQALQFALEIITANSPVDQRLRGETLVDLADWNLVSGETAAARQRYAQAWDALALAGDTTLLQHPRQLAYRASPFSAGRSRLDPAEATSYPLELRFTVTSGGRVRDVVAQPNNLSEGVVRSVATALTRARYAPRIENGSTVDTENVSFTEQVLVRNPPPDAPANAD